MRRDLQADRAFERHSGQHRPADVLVRHEYAVIAQQDNAARSERFGNGAPKVRRGNKAVRFLIDADALGEQGRIMREEFERRGCRSERRRIRWVSVDHRADVCALAVYRGVHGCLEMESRSIQRGIAAVVDGNHI